MSHIMSFDRFVSKKTQSHDNKGYRMKTRLWIVWNRCAECCGSFCPLVELYEMCWCIIYECKAHGQSLKKKPKHCNSNYACIYLSQHYVKYRYRHTPACTHNDTNSSSLHTDLLPGHPDPSTCTPTIVYGFPLQLIKLCHDFHGNLNRYLLHYSTTQTVLFKVHNTPHYYSCLHH